MNLNSNKFLRGPFNAETVERAFRRHSAEVGGGWDIQHNPDGTHQYVTERGRTVPMGEWTDVPYAAANFTASGGTWGVDSVDQATLAYTLIGKTMTIVFFISSTDVTGASVATLSIAIPDGYIAAKKTANACFIDNAGVSELGIAQVAVGGRTVSIGTSAGLFTATAGDDTSVLGQLTFEIQ